MEQALNNYFKGELLSNFVLLLCGLLCVAGAFFLLKLHNEVYDGLAYSFFPLGIVIMLSSFPSIKRIYEKKKIFKREKSDVLRNLLIGEKEYIISDLGGYEKHITLFSGMFVLSIILILICYLAEKKQLMMGLATGICISSVILLCHQLISGFRKKLFLHEIKKYFQN